MAYAPLDRSAILNALTLLGRHLHKEGLRGDLFVVGGAAMALVYDDRRVTRDVNAIFEPKTRIYELVADVATNSGLRRTGSTTASGGLLSPTRSRDPCLTSTPRSAGRVA